MEQISSNWSLYGLVYFEHDREVVEERNEAERPLGFFGSWQEMDGENRVDPSNVRSHFFSFIVRQPTTDSDKVNSLGFDYLLDSVLRVTRNDVPAIAVPLFNRMRLVRC